MMKQTSADIYGTVVRVDTEVDEPGFVNLPIKRLSWKSHKITPSARDDTHVRILRIIKGRDESEFTEFLKVELSA